MLSAAERLSSEKRSRKSSGPPPVACRIREYRDRHGLSLRDLVEAVGGFTHETIRQWELGAYMPHLASAYQLARFFGCTVYDLWPDAEPAQQKQPASK